MQRKKPLVSKKGLIRSAPLRRRPTEPQEARKIRKRPSTRKPAKWAEWRQQERGACVFRAKRPWPGQNEGAVERWVMLCEWPGCNEPATEWHHLLGRRMEPWSSSRLLTVMTCKQHHDAGHASAGNRQLWRLQLLVRKHDNLLAYIESVTSLSALGLEDPPLGRLDHAEQWLRHAVDVLRAEGIPPPYWVESTGV